MIDVTMADLIKKCSMAWYSLAQPGLALEYVGMVTRLHQLYPKLWLSTGNHTKSCTPVFRLSPALGQGWDRLV